MEMKSLNEKEYELLERCLIASELEPTRVIRVLKIVKRRVGTEKLKEMFIKYPKFIELAHRISPFLFEKSWRESGYE